MMLSIAIAVLSIGPTLSGSIVMTGRDLSTLRVFSLTASSTRELPLPANLQIEGYEADGPNIIGWSYLNETVFQLKVESKKVTVRNKVRRMVTFASSRDNKICFIANHQMYVADRQLKHERIVAKVDDEIQSMSPRYERAYFRCYWLDDQRIVVDYVDPRSDFSQAHQKVFLLDLKSHVRQLVGQESEVLAVSRQGIVLLRDFHDNKIVQVQFRQGKEIDRTVLPFSWAQATFDHSGNFLATVDPNPKGKVGIFAVPITRPIGTFRVPGLTDVDTLTWLQ